MLRARQFAFALILTLPLAWAATSSLPLEEPLEAQVAPCDAIGTGCEPIKRTGGSYSHDTDFSFVVDPTQNTLEMNNSFEMMGPTDHSLVFGFLDLNGAALTRGPQTGRFRTSCRMTHFLDGRIQCGKVVLNAAGVFTGIVYREIISTLGPIRTLAQLQQAMTQPDTNGDFFPDGMEVATGDGNFHDANGDSVWESFTAAGTTKRGRAFTLSLPMVTVDIPSATRGQANRAACTSWAALQAAGQGIAGAQEYCMPADQTGRVSFNLPGLSDKLHKGPNVGTNNSGLWQLAINVVGMGTVSSAPVGIDCGTTCVSDFNKSNTITLNALAATGWTFSAWSGTSADCNDGVIDLTAPTSCTATFVQGGTPPPTTGPVISRAYFPIPGSWETPTGAMVVEFTGGTGPYVMLYAPCQTCATQNDEVSNPTGMVPPGPPFPMSGPPRWTTNIAPPYRPGAAAHVAAGGSWWAIVRDSTGAKSPAVRVEGVGATP